MVNFQNIEAKYDRDGFVAPIEIMTPHEALELRKDYEKAEFELKDDDERLSLLRAYPNRLLPLFDKLTRHERLVNAAASILGPNLIVWSAQLFIKEKKSPQIVSWHQDLTYWGLDDVQETTCWFAVSEASERAGCMRFVPGTHKSKIVEHIDTFAKDNLLSRGQEIAVNVDEKKAVSAELNAGEASMHHGLLFHSSGPNRTNDRRIGSAIRYIKPSMRQHSGDKPLVTLAYGEDQHGNFTIAGSPKGRLLEEDFELCRQDNLLKKRLLF